MSLVSGRHPVDPRHKRVVHEQELPPTPQILVVDDEKSQRCLIRKSLESVGYRVLATATGQEALKILAQEPTDLVLLDIMMPGMNGFMTCSEIRKSSDVPIIMLSSLADDDNIARGLDTGADDYMVKPCVFIELHALIYALLRRYAWTQLDEQRIHPVATHVGVKLASGDEVAQHLHEQVQADPRNPQRMMNPKGMGHKVMPNS